MVDFNINENLNNLDQDTRDQIEEAVGKTYRKLRPCGKSLDILYTQFIKNVEPNFSPKCGKCKKRVVNFWKQRLTNWKRY
jgi:hypothetical protein